MSLPTLSFACGNYDRMAPMRDGDVAIDGFDLNYITVDKPREIFDRMVGKHEFDASELSASEFISLMGAERAGGPENPFVAIPVFPSKAFRHGFICINRNSGISSPKDLEGKRVGVPLYTMTAALWIRGHLQHEYDVDLNAIHWVQGAIEKAGSHGDPSALPLLKDVPIEINRSDRSLSELLALGEIDAILGSRLPDSLHTSADVVRLFPDYRSVERAFYQRTRIHPIMHLVAIRKDVYQNNPAIAPALYRACEESKKRALEELRFSAAQKVMLPWLFPDLDEVNEVFGGDPWPYGIEPNRSTLDAQIAYMVEQHFIAEPMGVDDLFVPVSL